MVKFWPFIDRSKVVVQNLFPKKLLKRLYTDRPKQKLGKNKLKIKSITLLIFTTFKSGISVIMTARNVPTPKTTLYKQMRTYAVDGTSNIKDSA